MSSAVGKFVATISEAKDPDAYWAALDELAASLGGHRLFTVTMVDMQAGLVRRAYSNRPVEYPTSGTKPLRGNSGEWFETVFNRRENFVANTIGDIALVFPDHELIGSMGLGSVVNLPIVIGNELVATVNLLDETGHYTAERVAAIQSGLAVPARLCVALALRAGAFAEGAA